MARAIRRVSLEKGHDPAGFTLQCFGGAGGQHACLVADALEMDTVLIHPLAGVLSAYGMGVADQSALRAQAIERAFDDAGHRQAAAGAGRPRHGSGIANCARSTDCGCLTRVCVANLRYQGTDTSLPVAFGPRGHHAPRLSKTAHRRHFGFVTPERALVLESVSAEASLKGESVSVPILPRGDGTPPKPIDHVEMWSGGAAHRAPVFARADCRAGG